VRVLVWNIGAGSPGGSRRHEQAWRHLAERGDFDVALLQETEEPPAWRADHWRSVVWRPKYAQTRKGRKLWGCAVLALDLTLEAYEPTQDFPWLGALPGSSAVAWTTTGPKWLASVHLTARPIAVDLLHTHPLEGIETTTRDGSLWETNVVPHELHRLFGQETFLWGGDLNCDPKMDDRPRFAGGTRRAFEIYREAGAVDARTRFHSTYQQTFFRPGTDSYQLDHVFVDRITEGRLTSWAVDPLPATAADPLSDHAPIMLTLDAE